MKNTGDAYFDSEEFRNILDNYEESVKSGHPIYMDADDLADIADYYHFTGNDEEANEVIEYALSLYPNATLPNVFKARQALTLGEIEMAREYVEQIENKDDPEYYYIQAEMLVAQDKVEEADAYLRDYFLTVPPDEYQDFVMDVANIYFDYGQNEKAYEWLMRTKGDTSNDFKELMARTLFGLGNYKESERLFTELLDQDPYCKRYWNALANAQIMNEDYQEAVTSSEYAIAIDPNDPEGILNKANALYRLEHYEKAIQCYDRYGEISKPDEYSLLHKSSCLFNIARHEEAITTLHQALAICPSDSNLLLQIYHELALCYSILHRKDEAIEYIDRALDLNRNQADLLVVKGHIYLENDCESEATKVFKTAIIRSDNDPDIIMRILVSLYDNRYLTTCYAMFKRFFSTIVDEDYNQGFSYMALCCWDLGYVEEFLFYLRMAAERNPRETRSVLGFIFPEEMAVKDYYNYIYQQLKK